MNGSQHFSPVRLAATRTWIIHRPKIVVLAAVLTIVACTGGEPHAEARDNVRRRRLSRLLARLLALALVGAGASCGGLGDPDAAARDRFSDEATQIAEALELPPGYELLGITDDRAQTPRENQGGGQGGNVQVRFRPPDGTTTEQALTDFDALYASPEMTRAEYSGDNRCERDYLSMVWAAPTHILYLRYRRVTGYLNSVDIAYTHEGLVTAGTPTIDTPVDLPRCS
jgi:hypothetical protein